MMLGIGGARRSSSLRLDWLHQSAVDRRRLNAICPELKAILAGSCCNRWFGFAELEAGMIGTPTTAALAAAKERPLAGHVPERATAASCHQPHSAENGRRRQP